MTEYLDIVNENDEVVGKDTRENVHRDYKIHRGIHVFVINSKKELLLQKRSQSKTDRPGYFDASVGAQVRAGEAYEGAATRETKEELGFVPEKLIKITDYKSYSKRQRENRRLFVTFFDGPFKLDQQEIENVEFLPINTIQEKIRGSKLFTEGFKLSLAHYMMYAKIAK